MRANRYQLEKYIDKTRDIKDNRIKVARAVFSYISESGAEYRKSFVSVPFTSESKFWDIAPRQIEVTE
jgi:hypothetical protein